MAVDVEIGEQFDEARIGAVIEHDEAGIHAVAATAQIDIVGIDMAADMVAGLEQRDVVCGMQMVRGGQPGDAAADDGDLHDAPPQRCGTRWMRATS